MAKIVKVRKSGGIIETKNEGKIRVAAYCRVSTDSDEQQMSFDTQVEVYKDRISANPEWKLAGIYADDGISGTGVAKRTEFLRMLEDARAGKIDRIITKSISRFARNTLECIQYVRELKALGVTILFEKENIDTAGAFSEMLLTVMAAFAQEESRSLSENIKWGVRKRFEEGSDRWIPIFGYRKNEETGETYIIVQKEADIVRRIFDMYERGSSYMEIAGALEKDNILTSEGNTKWFSKNIGAILRNEKYCGDIILQKYYIKDHLSHKIVRNSGREVPMYYVNDHHDAIVTHKQFDRVQKIRKLKSSNGGDILYPYGESLMKCPYCGRPLGCRKMLTIGEKRSWECDHCHGFIMRSRTVDAAVLNAYREHYGQDDKESVEYYWVEEYIEKIDIGKHNGDDDKTITVHWKDGESTEVQTNIKKDIYLPRSLASANEEAKREKRKNGKSA